VTSLLAEINFIIHEKTKEAIKLKATRKAANASESRMTPFQEGKDDEAISTNQAPYHVNQAHDVEDVTQARE